LTAHGGQGTPSVTEAFFGELAARTHEPLLKRASGTLRFDLGDRERVQHWHVTMREGGVTVSRRRAKADAVVRLDKRTFEAMVTGTLNATAAVLRGDLVSEGDLGMLLLFQRVFPAPRRSGATDPSGPRSSSA
jgi:putative sterol carrier protein